MVKETGQIASNTNVSLFITCIVDSFFPRVPARNIGSGHNRCPNGRSRLSGVGHKIAAS